MYTNNMHIMKKYKTKLTPTLHLLTINAQGLRDKTKRHRLYEWCKQQHPDILFIQETHFTNELENIIAKEWNGTAIHSYGSSQSRGVSILLGSKLQFEHIDTYCTGDGRLLLTNIQTKDGVYCLVNIYSPNDTNSRNTFFKNANNVITEKCMGYLIIGGDFNDTINPKLDRKSKATSRKLKHAVYGLNSLIKQSKLCDIWRTKNPQIQQFTWRRKHAHEASRIDFWLISANLINTVQSCDIRPALIKYTDHQAVSLRIISDTASRGHGYWKLNNSLLGDKDYANCVSNAIEKSIAESHANQLNARQTWDMCKIAIKENTIIFAKQNASVRRTALCKLEGKLRHLNAIPDANTFNSKQHEFEITELEHEIEAMYDYKAKGAQIRAKTKWIEKGETNSKYFLGLEKNTQARKSILRLKDTHGNITSNQSEILQLQTHFFQDLYSSKHIPTEHIDTYIQHTQLEQVLSKEDSQSCDGSLTLAECKNVVHSMKNNKSPGIDGLSVEFYQTFWNIVGTHVVNSLNESYDNGSLSPLQRQGLITLLYKSGDPLNLDNWRPITLLNVDYKIAAHALANRMQKVANTIINTDQTGYIKNRYIGFNIRQIQDIIDYAEDFKIDGAIIFIDFKKAFDTLEWNFMVSTLHAFGFGESFIKWIKTLYKNASSCTVNNGWLSEHFAIQRGVRQGCPISALLFVLVAEILSNRIRQSKDIHGIEVKRNSVKHKLKISQLADDTTLFANSKSDIKHNLKTIEEFGQASGLCLNKQKTYGLWLGDLENCTENIGNIKWSTDPIKTLGVYFGHDTNKFSSWSKRNLTMLGKITIIKTLILPKLAY
jgi:exonuclease III